MGVIAIMIWGQTDLVAEGPDGVDGIAAGKEGGNQIQQDGEPLPFQ